MSEIGEEFHSIIKLISGEEIFALVSIEENYEDSVIILQSPVVIKTILHHGTQLVKIKPWIELSDDDVFMIKQDRVLTMTESKDKKLIKIYEDYLNHDTDIFQNQSIKVDVTEKMGYLASVDESRKFLEELFKITKPKES